MTITDKECNFPEAYDFEFVCQDCGHTWIVNTIHVPFEERMKYLYNQVCPVCESLHVVESEGSRNDWEQ